MLDPSPSRTTRTRKRKGTVFASRRGQQRLWTPSTQQRTHLHRWSSGGARSVKCSATSSRRHPSNYNRVKSSRLHPSSDNEVTRAVGITFLSRPQSRLKIFRPVLGHPCLIMCARAWSTHCSGSCIKFRRHRQLKSISSFLATITITITTTTTTKTFRIIMMLMHPSWARPR